MNNIYIKYALNYQLIETVLQKLNKKRINFFIDFNSICKGFYNKETVVYEIGEYITNNKVSDALLVELKEFLNNLFKIFKKYDPFFVIFYDSGICVQNKLIMPSYKSGRNIENLLLEDQKQTDFFRAIKNYYYNKIVVDFTKEDLSVVHYIKDYETDCVPHYCIKYDIYEAQSTDVLNVILSVDKDLLQTCEYTNTIQCVTAFKADKETGKFKINFQIYDKKNALSYIYKNFKPGILTAKHIPMVLSLSGDISDEIPGISGIGPAKAIKLIENNNTPAKLNDLTNSINNQPDIIKNNISTIIRNMKLIDFDEQIKRLPRNFLK